MTAATAQTERAAWLERRRSGIGGSDVAGILGLSPWESPYSIWLSKVATVETTAKEVTDAMEFGTRAEPMLARWFEDRNDGLFIAGEQAQIRHPDHPERMCTLDGLVFDHPHRGGPIDVGGALGAAEWKTSGDTAAEWEAEIPDHYACQAAWTMHVTDLDRVWFGVLHLAFGRPQFRTYLFERDAIDEALIVEKCTEFWERYVLTGTAPPVDNHPATLDALKKRWPTAEDSVEADDAARILVARRHAHKATLEMVEANLDTVENQIRALLADRAALVDGTTPKGKPKVIASWKFQPDRRVDLDRLRAAWPDLVAEFTTESKKRVLRVPAPKESTT